MVVVDKASSSRASATSQGFGERSAAAVQADRRQQAGELFNRQQAAFGGHPWTAAELNRIEAAGKAVQAAIMDGPSPAHTLRFKDLLEQFRQATTPIHILAEQAEQDAVAPVNAFAGVMRELGERDERHTLLVYKACSNIGGRSLRFRCRGLVKKGSGELPIESLPEVVKLVEQAQASGVPGERVAVMLDQVSQAIGGVA